MRLLPASAASFSSFSLASSLSPSLLSSSSSLPAIRIKLRPASPPSYAAVYSYDSAELLLRKLSDRKLHSPRCSLRQAVLIQNALPLLTPCTPPLSPEWAAPQKHRRYAVDDVLLFESDNDNDKETLAETTLTSPPPPYHHQPLLASLDDFDDVFTTEPPPSLDGGSELVSLSLQLSFNKRAAAAAGSSHDNSNDDINLLDDETTTVGYMPCSKRAKLNSNNNVTNVLSASSSSSSSNNCAAADHAMDLVTSVVEVEPPSILACV